jgi:ADP-ribose pyrophosphatase YjhB (NUDIX family)
MTTPQFDVTVRGLIIDQNELLMVTHTPDAPYHALPGGRLEPGETLENGLIRELTEETGITATIGPLLFVNQWLSPTHHRVEFFFWVYNGADFRHADPTSASHGFELASIIFGNAADPAFNLLPAFLQTEFPQLLKLGDRYTLRLINST